MTTPLEDALRELNQAVVGYALAVSAAAVTEGLDTQEKYDAYRAALRRVVYEARRETLADTLDVLCRGTTGQAEPWPPYAARLRARYAAECDAEPAAPQGAEEETYAGTDT